MTAQSKIFLEDGERKFSYGDLLNFVLNTDTYFPIVKTDSLRDCYFNLILALLNDRNTTLLDADLSNAELKSLNVERLGGFEKIRDKKSFASPDELIDTLKNSASKITLFTSGTSGIPKRVSHNIATLARGVRSAKGYDNHIWGLAYNPTHIAGIQVLLQALFNGNTIVNLFGKSSGEIFRLIDTRKITHLSATPSFYRLLLVESTPRRGVKRVSCGGEKSDTRLHQKLAEIFPEAKINNIYASTEFGTLLVSNGEYFRIDKKFADKIKIENGELLVNQTLITADTPSKTGSQWYNTGDKVAFCDGENNLFKFVGRDINMINVGGYKVNLEEVEDALRRMEQIVDARAYGRNNSVLGKILCADVKLAPNTKLEERDIREFLEQELQNFKIPRRINFVKSIEFTRSGKIKR